MAVERKEDLLGGSALLNVVESTDRIVRELHGATMLQLPDGNFVGLVPKGMALVGLKDLMKPYLMAPERRKGTANFFDEKSLVDWVKRFADSNSVLFSNNSMEAPTITAILDYNPGGPNNFDARFGEHRGIYRFPLSKSWKIWNKVGESWLSQSDFSQFLEDNMLDVIMPPAPPGEGQPDTLTSNERAILEILFQISAVVASPQRLRELAAGLRMREQLEVADVKNNDTGEVELRFQNQLQEMDGKPLKIPNAFVIGIPVFEGGLADRMIVRLRFRYDRSKKEARWQLQLRRPDLVFESAFSDVVARVHGQTNLPLFLGSPEG